MNELNCELCLKDINCISNCCLKGEDIVKITIESKNGFENKHLCHKCGDTYRKTKKMLNLIKTESQINLLD